MRTSRDSGDFLGDIVVAATQARKFVEGMSFESFREDTKTQYAVIRAFEIIGEATKNVPPDAREEIPDLPWRRMAGMRDVLIHNYLGVDLQVVWKAVQVELPVVLRVLREAGVEPTDL